MLLDGNLNPKISDFGLARLDDEEKTHITTRIAGTMSVISPLIIRLKKSFLDHELESVDCVLQRVHGTGICIMGSLVLQG